ncbi:trehalase-like [Athalia rosae]|uniref:trehalase-like n=1 Tax=Athalia rosae TaxID=37344 RepID=UPI0020343414|nr:trehalase-like [Athalia rosae]XP_048509572.1 trehalase-like [Athalia rosae]
MSRWWCYFGTCLLILQLCESASLRCSTTTAFGKSYIDCDNPIYCRGELLKTMQLAELFNDSKTFVDLFQLHDPEVTLSNFDTMMSETGNNPDRARLEKFLEDNFSQESELDDWNPPDWQPNPVAFMRIRDQKFRKWAQDLNVIWKQLMRKMKPEVAEHPKRHSLIYLNNPFVVPGGRFRESYYWDTYWAMTGMLLSEMNDTVRGILENFYSLVERFGFIPNGSRVYYLMRSQPPFLMLMTQKYLEFTEDIGFLGRHIGTLEKEFNFWLRERTTELEVCGKTYKLARYAVRSVGPRPESYREDYRLGKTVKGDRLDGFYNDIKAAAESGWDFSSRWFDGTNEDLVGNLSTIRTETVIPVELNALLEKNARLLAEFHLRLNNPVKAAHYATIAQDFQEAIDNVLWNEEEHMWLDYDTVKKVSKTKFYPTNLTPLYTRSYDRSRAKDLARWSVAHLEKFKILDFMGGTPASTENTGEQWDYPNAWPPLQSILVLGLHGTGWEPATSVAKTLATRWLRANLAGFTEYNEMFEKYDAISPGRFGGGGEYNVQAGFGWTNGVVMEFLDLYSDTITSEDSQVTTETTVER